MMIISSNRELAVSMIPNAVGFKFIGITHAGEQIECVVELDGAWCHRVIEVATGERCFGRLRGWVRK